MNTKVSHLTTARSAARKLEVFARVILVGERSPELGFLKSALADCGLVVEDAPVDHLPWKEATTFHAALVNASAPDPSWQQAVGLIKSRFKVPVLVLLPIAQQDSIPSVAALDADDLAFLPVRIEEITARIDLLLWKANKQNSLRYPLVERRRSHHERAVTRTGTLTRHAGEQLLVNDREKKVTVGEQAIHLSPNVYKLLLLLASDPGRVFSVHEISTHLWPKKRVQSSDVQQYIHLLRQKIEKDPGNPVWVQTEPGFGYKLNRTE